MDFITRNDSDLEYTEMLNDKKSAQYSLKKKLLDAEEELSVTGKLHVGRKCTQEYIVYSFYTGIFDKNEVHSIIKKHWSKDKTECRKRKEQNICKSVSDVVNEEIYDLFLKGYEVLDL